jgi:AmmeMemoRadiSam system protein B
LKEIEGFGDYIAPFHLDHPQFFGGVVPHAGWYFSGRLAALVFHLCAERAQPDVVALFGGHLGAGPGILYADRFWETPLGDLEIDGDLTQALAQNTGLRKEGAATNDNTVEIQLPLIKHYFPQSRLLALRSPHDETAIGLGALAADLARKQGKTLMAFGSTDLTHYGPNYGYSPAGRGPKAVEWVKKENDRGFIDRIVAMDGPGALEHAARSQSACSAGGAVSAMAATRALGSDKGCLVDYYTSHDVMPGDSFVGYAGILF